ncbi:hypothetical protein GDN83_23045 [Gordonia jinghuaiqii]|uniref:Uncharacterized protein n=1 Tax=Gordonia jinghuaiqii TaxID=2758710 RepID=A0A7D7LSW4_9ACTN|nr:hypothetical protein [Gordonia jinghuaiqii]MCR5980564.1 hypothetical protein [Gordonia jinghuaiqii]QMT02625.1 hypothetical protein H1R19_05630 [Gordonia jinghuaiqii]
MAHELAILQAARLKGRLSPELAATSAGIDIDTAQGVIADLRDAGNLKGEPSVRLTPEGKIALAELVDAERTTVDHEALAALYEEFDDHNTALKQIITDWQIRDGAPNDHTDAAYDGGVIDRLVALDAAFQPLVARITGQAPRLLTFARRFTNAIEQLRGGDTSYVARPIADSYHTVWFEFHEELIGLLGLSRAEEAAAGRAV